MANEFRGRPAAIVNAAPSAQMPMLLRHPRLYLLGYWLTMLVGLAVSPGPSSGAPFRLFAQVIAAGSVVLPVLWAFQIVQYTSRLEPALNKQKRALHIAAALFWLPIGLMLARIAWQITPQEMLVSQVWIVANNLAGIAILGLLVVAAREMVRAERERGLPTHGGILTFLLICFSGILAGYASRRLRKLAATADASGAASTAPAP